MGTHKTPVQEALGLQIAAPGLLSMSEQVLWLSSCQTFLDFHRFLQAFLCPQTPLEKNNCPKIICEVWSRSAASVEDQKKP